MRPIDLARAHGLSTQAVRNYEDAEILPRSKRSAHGYRVYTPRHAAALRTFLALVPAHGHATATAIMRTVNGGGLPAALRLIDDGHAQLAQDRSTLEAVERALRDLAPPREAEPGVTFIGPLARRLRIKPATLRKWERAGLTVPRRDPRTGYRVYTAADVRDVLLAHQLRRGGYGLEQIRQVLDQVRAAGGMEPLQATLRDWHDRLTARGLAMLAAAAALDAYLREGNFATGEGI
ncbi:MULTISPECIES: MerR family transcriptional regulator [unclassified Nonomuraea]|uniref:MerR family transcriptional regulator n=1 Tax=unclassified Nonomuraea TaxID=2593643 RepID=UPI0033E42869